MSEEKRDKGWEYLHSAAEEGSFYEDDGSWETQNADGSSSCYGTDGSWGRRMPTVAHPSMALTEVLDLKTLMEAAHIMEPMAVGGEECRR